jgi:acid phosphatase type 7
MRRFAILALLAFLAGGSQALSAPSRSEAPQATFGATADAYVSSGARRKNFGRARSLRVLPRPVMRTYLRVKVQGLAAPVTRATLRVHSKTLGRGFQVRATGGSWAERRLTFRNAPRPGRVVGSVGRLRRNWITADVTRGVSGNGTFNFVLTGRGATLTSREGGRRPQLIVETEPAQAPQTLIAAGDIASCASNGDEQTAALVDTVPGTVAALGDLVYEDGTAQEFAQCYEPSWGRFKARTKPTTGNHEYQTGNASGYFGYWGAAAGSAAQGWYSYELGAWHVVVLNSNCSFVGGCQTGSPQEAWLRADLASHQNRCTLGYWHHPRFSTGFFTGTSSVGPLFQALYDANADLVLVGHAHNYQRWAPLNPAGAVDRARGMREFVVGSGGRDFHSVAPPAAGQEAANADTFGVLRLTLKGTSYDWQFMPVAGRTFTDSGSQACH